MKDIILINVYGSWGSEIYSTANTLAEAKRKAQAASARDPKNEYCVELEPGGFDNPLFVGGAQVNG